MAHLLIVDDEQSICWGLAELAESWATPRRSPPRPSRVSSGPAQRARRDRARRSPAGHGRPDGHAAVSAQELGPVPIIVITAYGELATAVEAVRNGAFEYLIKPFELDVAERAIQRRLESPGPSDPCAPPAAASGDRAARSSARRRPCRRSSSGSPWWPRPTPASTCAARAARARSWSPGRSTATAAAPAGRSWP